MAGKWDQVAQSEKFQALDATQRQAVRGAFFDREIRPNAPAALLAEVQSAFFTRTERDVFGQQENASEGVGVMDYVNEFGAGLEEGTGAVLQGAGELLDQGGQWVDRGLRSIGLGDAIDAGDRALGGHSPASAARGVGDYFQDGGDALRERQSEAAKQARADSTPQGDITDPSSWSLGDDPSAAGYGMQIANLIGQFAPQAAALLAPGSQARGLAMAGVGGLQGGGAAGEDAEQYVMQQSDDDLSKNSGMYRDLVSQGLEPQEARRQTAAAARGAAFAGAAPVAAGGGALTHYILGPFQKAIGGGVGRRLGYGLAVDAPAEGAQEAAETVTGRAAQNQATGGNRDTTDGTFGDVVLGAVAGGGHAGLGAAMGERLPSRRMPTPDDLVRERGPEDIAAAEEQHQADLDAEARQWFERRRADERSRAEVSEQFGEEGAAVWQNADHDLPVRIRGIEPEPDEAGRRYARVERDGQESFVPLDELRAADTPPGEAQATDDTGTIPNPRERRLGIDNDIRVAEKVGADEDAARLRNAKALFVRAMERDAAGDREMGSRLRQRGLDIHREIYGDPESLMPERPASFPVPYEFDGELEAAGRPPAAGPAPRRGEMLDGTPDERLSQPAARLRQGDQETGESLIYGDGPVARRGNANTGMDQPFAGARATDTASEAPKSSYDPTQAADTPRHRRREQTSGRRAQAYLADNTPVPVRYRVMDLDELTPSNDPDGAVNPAFPAELQPRDRTGKNSQVQVRNIAARLNPERLAESMDAGSGSPIVGPDGVVESGNGRTMAIAQAYRSGSPQARRYRQFVQQRAQDFGIDPEVVNGMRNPVLVRERTGSIDRAEFARRANEADVASMTPFETAVADADRLSAEDMAEWTTDESGDPLAASNRAFTRRFAQRLGNNEASRYRGRDGMPSAELGERMLRAVFAKGYADEQGRPSPDMLEMVTERQGSLRNLTLALQSAAPDFAVARDYGGEQAAAMIDTVVDAVRVVRQARTSGVAVRELVGQNDAFAQAVPRDTAALAMFMANNARSRRGLADSLAMIAAATRRRAESQRNGALFDDPVSNEDITHAATRQDPLATDDGQPGGGGDATRGDRTGSGETASGQEADRAQAPSEEPGLDDSLLSTYDEQELVDRDSERTAPRAGGRDATLEEEHTPASERRAAEIAQQMSPGEIRAELDALTSRLDERYNQGMRGAGSNIYLPRTHFATDDELARRNDLMQALPSQSQQRAEARQRIEQRARDRAASRASTNATDSNGAESSRESGRERPSTNAPITWQRRGKSRVWDGSNGNLIVDHGFQVGGERIPMLMVFKDQQAYQRGDNFATGNSVREAKQLAQDHASQALSEPAGSDQSRRESDRAQAGIPGRRQPDNEIPTARRRNKPLEYTGYSGQSRSARSYTEVGQYRIAKVHDGLYEVIDASGQAVSQLAGPNGALQEAQRLIERGGVTDHGEQMYAKRESSGDRQGWEPPSVDQVIDALEGMRDQLGDISVIGSTSELPLASQLQMLRDGVDADEVRGLYIGDQLYLVAGNNDSLQQAIQTAVHEAVGHKGIRGVLGDEIVPVMRQLYRSLPHDKRGREALQEVLDTYTHLDRNDPDDQVAIAEEMVAHLLEKGYRPKVWQRAVAKIRELLRRLFPAMDWTYTDVLALGERSRDFLRSQATGRGDSEQRYSRRGWQDDFPNAVLAHPLRWASQHPDYEAAKAGDDRAALRLARDAVTPEFVEQVRGLIPAGSQPRIVPVLAQESAGRNRIPAMTAEVLANRLGIETVDTLAQRERVSRTGANAMERLQRQPTFDGDVTDGDYLLIDDTLTQGGTLAQLKTHIEDQGGRVLGVAALTGKQFSRKIAVDPATLDQVRDRFGSVEDQWRAAFGYGFEGLTQSEARTLLTFERGRLSPDELRDRIPALRDANVDGLGEGATGSRSGPEAPLDPSLYSLRPRREPTADQFDDLDAEQRDFMAKFGSKTATRRAMDWYRDLTRRAMLRIRQGMVDQYAALKELDEKRFGKDGALAEDITSSSWVLARMSNAASGALHAMLHNGRIYLDPDQKVIDIRDDDAKGLGAVLGQLGRPAEIERFMMWIAANRSSKLAGEGREFLFTEAEIRAGMQLNEGRLADGSSRRERYQKAFDEFQQYRDDVLAIAEQSGVIRPDQRAMWRDEFYVPFYRLKDDKDVNVQLCTSGLSRQQAYKRLKGGTDNINDLLQNTMMNFHHLLDASLKNQAAQQAMTNAEAMGIAHVVPESGRDTTKSTFVMQGGRKTFYEINDPMVFSAVSALAHPGMNNAIMKIMRGFKRVFTNMTTTTPQFIAANLMRDTLQAVATNEVSANVFKNIYDGAGTLRDQKKRARMLAAGGSFHFGHLYGNNPDELRAQLTRNLRDAKVVGVPGSRSSVVAAPAKLIRAGWAKWGDVNNFVENVNRAAIYDQNQDYGKLKAAFEARDLIDFSARGAWPAVRILTDIVPFLNARIQGLDKIYRSGIKPGANVLGAAFGKGQAGVSDKQAAARFWSVAGVTTLATIALYLNNRDDEDYQKLEDWQKDTYWFFKVGDQAFFIPKPFEVGAIATMAERITQQFVDDEATGALFAQRMGHMLTGTFAFSPVPQMMQPALDVYANRDSFTDRPIEGMGDQRLSPMLRRRDSTSRVARGTSWALNHTLGAIGNPETNPAALSPLQVDYLIQGYLGQVGAWAAGSLDVAWNVFDGKDEPAKRWYEYQPIRRFYTNLGDEPRYTRYGTVFYDGLREAERAYADVKEMGEMGRLEEARALARSKADVLKLRKPLMRAQRKLNDVRKQIEAIRRSNLDGELKRQRIDRLTALKNRIQQILGEKILEQRAGS